MRDISAPFDIYTSVTQPFKGDLGHMHNRKTYKQIKASYQDGAVFACCIVFYSLPGVLICNQPQYYKINKPILFNNISLPPINNTHIISDYKNETGCAEWKRTIYMALVHME